MKKIRRITHIKKFVNQKVYKLESNTFLLVITMELTKITSKGQVVIPSEIRKELHLEEGNQMIVSRMGKLVVMRKIAIKDPKEALERLVEFGQKFAEKRNIKNEEDVVRMIHKGKGIKGA